MLRPTASLVTLCLSLLTLVAPAAEPTAEVARISASGFIRHWPGELPVVLSVPHDGAAKPADIPDRPRGVTVRDSYAAALGHALRDALRERCGAAPQLIICELSRKKVDCNREIGEGAAGQPKAEQVWREYHASIDEAEAAVLARSKHGLYLDIHSHGHPKPRIEIGYLLKASELRLSDERLDADKSVAARSSIRWLSQRTPNSSAARRASAGCSRPAASPRCPRLARSCSWTTLISTAPTTSRRTDHATSHSSTPRSSRCPDRCGTRRPTGRPPPKRSRNRSRPTSSGISGRSCGKLTAAGRRRASPRASRA
jgi:hypothetical protein